SGFVELSGDNNCNTREATDSLKLIGRTAKATAKTYAISSVAIASLILFLLYTQEIKNFGNATLFNLESFKILIGLFIGGAIPCLFSSFALTSVNKTGGKVVEKARRQFREIKGLISGKTKPEYGKCVDVVAKASLKEMILPAMFSVIIPIVIGFVLGTQALGGFLIGSIITGFFITTSIATREVAWDNAKKYIKKGGVNKKNSFVHQTAATGDTVGNPYKGAVEMAINPMIMVFNIVSLLIVGFLV
ncbi:MAG: sodium/proton-translocating pyrophosphatase, partial [Patescibacteria group bacterium]|nr:sodium/proton-translocating pyrophosphatase [Patescibacteria group bacterium]